MLSTLTKDKPDILLTGEGGNGLDGHRGDGGDGGDGQPQPERYPPPEGYRIAVRLALVSITMLFLALTSAYIFNRAKNHPIIMPHALWVSTALIMTSSMTMELARRNLRRREGRFRIWILATMLLGAGFLVAQLVAWRQLVAEGFYLNRNFHSVYAYLFTGLHGVHLFGGLIALGYVTLRASEKWTTVRRRVSVDVTALYWHFLDGLWVYLLVLLFFWK
jgi:cytochrome c oxidase subunit III